jgi:hypothetical protein
MLLKANPPDMAQLGEILSGLRNLLNNRTEAELRTLDLNDTVRDASKLCLLKLPGGKWRCAPFFHRNHCEFDVIRSTFSKSSSTL